MKLFRGRLKRHLMNGKKIFFFGVTDAAGCSLCWNESTHYVRAIAVFKISLTLRVIHLPCFWTDRDGGEAKRKEGKDWLVVIYKHFALWLPFPRLKHKTRLVPRCGFFFSFSFFAFFSRLHLVWVFFLTCAHSQSRPAHPLFSLSLSEAHTKHTHTHPVHAYTHPGSPWLLDCHCSEITASRTRRSGLRAGISYKPSFIFLSDLAHSRPDIFNCRQVERELHASVFFPGLFLYISMMKHSRFLWLFPWSSPSASHGSWLVWKSS